MNWENYYFCGISVIPIKADGSKSPTIKWGDYKSKKPTYEEIKNWFDGQNVGIAAICGDVSDGLLCIDFDDPTAFEPWLEMIGQFVVDTPIVQTPKGGFHVWVKTDCAGTNRKLARDIKGNARIETRANGGYALLPGSPASCHPTGKCYEIISGDFSSIKRLTEAELNELIKAAIEFDDYQSKAVVNVEKSQYETDAEAPGNAYNEIGDVKRLLMKHGWKPIGRKGETSLWLRPGKSEGLSATFNFMGCNCLYVFSTCAFPFEAEKSYTPFGVYTMLEYSGDYHAAAEALIDQGYGTRDKAKNLIIGEKSIRIDQNGGEDEEQVNTYTDDESRVGNLILAVKNTLNNAADATTIWDIWSSMSDTEQLSARYIAKSMKIDGNSFERAIMLGRPKEVIEHVKPSELRNMSNVTLDELPLLGEIGYGLFTPGFSHLIISKPRVGKSELTAQVIAGWKLPTTFFTEETPLVIGTRINIYRASGLDFDDNCDFIPNGAGDRRYINKMIEDMQPGHILVIDTLRAYFEIQDECDGGLVTQALLPTLKAAKAKGITLIMLHHSRKSGGDDAIDSSSGSNALPGMFDTIMNIENKNEKLLITAKRRVGNAQPASIFWSNNLLHVDTSEPTRNETLYDKVFNVLSEFDFMSVEQIQELLDCDANKESIKSALRKLVSNGKAQTEHDVLGGRGKSQKWAKSKQKKLFASGSQIS